jgi:hypothetical protein
MCNDEIKKLPETECGSLNVKEDIKKMIFNAARSSGKILILGNGPESKWLEELYKAQGAQVERIEKTEYDAGHGVHYDVIVMDEFLKLHRELEPLSAEDFKKLLLEEPIVKVKKQPSTIHSRQQNYYRQKWSR